MHFKIDKKLPSLNEVILANRRNPYIGAKLKVDTENDICWFIRIALNKGYIQPCEEYPVAIFIEWGERTKKRDVDNVQSSQKFVLDSLVKMGVLENDSRKYVKQIYHNVVDADSDYVKVMIKPYSEVENLRQEIKENENE